MKYPLLVFSILTFGCYSDEYEWLNNYPKTYQDIFINGQTIRQGENICSQRHELIKPILDQYAGNPFTVLDIGAAQGYFSFRIAYDYPLSYSTMIEGEQLYEYKGMLSILYDLNNFKNIKHINKQITLQDIQLLNKENHYDVVLAFLVLHQLQYTQHLSEEVLLEEVLKLGDNVILELPDDVCPNLLKCAFSLSKKYNCKYLGCLKRTSSPTSKGLGHFFHFKMIP